MNLQCYSDDRAAASCAGEERLAMVVQRACGGAEASGSWRVVLRRLRWARRRMTVIRAPWQRGRSSVAGF